MVCGTRCNGRQYVTKDQLATEIAQVRALVQSAGLQGTSMSTQGWRLYGSCFSQPAVGASEVIAPEGKTLTLADAPATLLASGTTKLQWQPDGNLVLEDGEAVLWATGTDGRGKAVSVQADGNLVVYSEVDLAMGNAIWSSGSGNATAQEHTLVIMPNKNLYLLNAAGEKVWAALEKAPVPSSVAASNPVSNLANEWVALKFQSSDGNLILTNHGKETWQSGPAGSAGDYTLTFQDDGNLVVDGPDGSHKSVTKNKSVGGTKLIAQSDGNLVIYNADGHALWAAL